MLTDRLGRKKTLLLLEIVSILTWLTVAVSDADKPALFYLGGVLAGISRGGTNTIFKSQLHVDLLTTLS